MYFITVYASFLFTRVLQVISDIVIDKKKENNGKKDEIQILPYY